eukprot:g849.t1
MEPMHLVWAESSELENVTANVIHGAIYQARDDVNAIVHCHSRACVFVSNLPGDDPLTLYTQDGGAFYDKVAYHEFEGVANDHEEQENIARDLGTCAHTLVMRNHGAVTLGETVGEAWVRMFYFDRVCQAQMDIWCAGMKDEAKPVQDEILREMSRVYEEPKFRHGAEWKAMATYCDEKYGLA